MKKTIVHFDKRDGWTACGKAAKSSHRTIVKHVTAEIADVTCEACQRTSYFQDHERKERRMRK